MAADKKKNVPAKDELPEGYTSSQRPIDPLNKVRIDGVEYDQAALPEEARQLILQMRITDEEISRLGNMAAMLGDARQSYGYRLAALLPEPDGETRSQ